MKKLFKWLFIIFIVIPVVLAIIAPKDKKKSESETQTVEQKEIVQVKEKDIKSKIPDNVYWMMTKKDFPKAYKQWGQKGLDKINSLAPQVSELVAKSKKCDVLSEVALSDAKSKPKKNIVFFADCKNGERFYISEEDIVNQRSAVSLNEAFENLDKESYYRSCLNAVKARANHPSTVDSSIFGRNIKATPTGGVFVYMDFTAKNSFGLEEEFNAQCTWNEGKMSIEIYNK